MALQTCLRGLLAVCVFSWLAQAALANGGDTCSTATVIPSLPYHDFGTNCGAGHQYSTGSCPGSESGAEVVYVYSPPRDAFISVSVCESVELPKIYVFSDICIGSSSILWCGVLSCTSSTGQARPQIEAIEVLAGHSYYIMVDQPVLTPCNPLFEISVVDLGCKPCSPSAIPENEPTCGLVGGLQAYDLVNGGCASALPLFTAIASNQTVCATVASSSLTGARDTDWYEVVTDTPARVTWTVAAEAQLVVALPDNGGVADCSRLQCLTGIQTTSFCSPSSLAVNRQPGRWWLFVAPQAGSNLPCTTQYIVDVDVNPITPDINADGVINTIDLGILLSSWTLPGQPACGLHDLCPGDLNIDGIVNSADLGMLLAAWTLS